MSMYLGQKVAPSYYFKINRSLYDCCTSLNPASSIVRYQIMLQCWQIKNSDRPTFSTLAGKLQQHHSDILQSGTFISSSPY